MHYLRWPITNGQALPPEKLHQLAHAVLRIATIATLLAAFLGGKFSFVRFASESATSQWLELRLWFTLATIVGIALQRIIFDTRVQLLRSRQLAWMLAAVCGLNAGLFLHLMWFGTPDSIIPYATDLAYVAIHAVLFAYLIRTNDDVLIFIYFAEAIGLVLFVFAFAGFGHPELYGIGWAPFGTPITFYRIEFLVFCGALYAAVHTSQRRARDLHMVMAAIGLFATLSSLSKAALLALALSGIYLVAAFLVVARPQRAVTVIAIYLVISGAIALHWSERFGARLNYLQPAGAVVIESPPTAAATPSVRTVQASASSDLNQGAAVVQFDPNQLLMTNTVLVNDQTQRIRLFIHAWDQFLTNKLRGVGFGRFDVKMISSNGTDFDHYRYPHNVILELLAATGVIGAALFGIAVMIGLVVIHQAAGRDPDLLFLVAYPIFVLVSAQFTGDIFDFRGFFLISCVIAAAAWPNEKAVFS
jgi:O-Antigen ligase